MTLSDILARLNGFENGTNREGASVMRHAFGESRDIDISDFGESPATDEDAEARAAIVALVTALAAKGLIDVTLPE